MGFFIGALSGAVAAGGIYYAYSSTIQQRTLKQCVELHELSMHLKEPPVVHNPPRAAATRVPTRPFRDEFMQRWNDGLYNLSAVDRFTADIAKRIFRS